MNEQERIDAIEALSGLFLKEMRDLDIEHILAQDKEALMHSTIGILRKMHEQDMLEAHTIYSRVLQKNWADATPQEVAICKNAVQAMREVLAEEKG